MVAALLKTLLKWGNLETSNFVQVFVTILKAKCLNSLNIIKYLFHPCTGCNRSLLLQLYNSLIRSQKDYGAPIYSHTNNTALKLQDSFQSAALRLALGALHTSPTLSLCAEAGVPPLQFRFLSHTANFLVSTAQFPRNPIFLPSFCTQNSLHLFLETHLGKHLRLEPPSSYLFIFSSLDTYSISYPTRPDCLTPISQLNVPQAHQSHHH